MGPGIEFMERGALRNVFLGALAYGGGGTVFWIGLTAMSMLSKAHGLPAAENRDNFIMAAYLVGVGTGFSTLGFIVATTPWRSWRNQPTLRVVLLSAGLGLFASIFPVAGITFFLPGLPMIIRKFPLPGMVVYYYSSPGVICGLFGFFLSRVLPPGKRSPG
jgi:hypothetical protein